MHSKNKRVSEGGFSLVELLVVMIVMSIIMVAVFSLLKSSMNVANATFELTDARENLRTAHDYINRDILNAGYGLNDYDKIQVPKVFVTSYLATNAIDDVNKPVNSGYVNLPMLSSDLDPGAVAVLGTSPAVTVLDSTDRITVLRLDTAFDKIVIPTGKITGNGAIITMPSTDGARLASGEVYFFTSASGTAFGRVTSITTAAGVSTVGFAASNSYGLNVPAATGPINVVGAGNASGISTQSVNLRRAYITNYFVNSNNQLVKREFGGAGAGFTDYLVAEHIKGLSFRYILGVNNSNGTVQQPVSQLTSKSQQDAVRQVEIKITAETTHSTNFQANTRGQDTMTTISAARNLQYRQVQQPKSPS
jgi:prepilin-type N-terminal cleavage/methylation domain-containing protein